MASALRTSPSGLPEEPAITPEGRAVGADDLVALPGQGGDQPASPGFGVVGVTAEDDDPQLLLSGVILASCS